MTIETKITYTSREIESLIHVGKLLTEMMNDNRLPDVTIKTAEDAFDNLTCLIALDKEAMACLQNEGW